MEFSLKDDTMSHGVTVIGEIVSEYQEISQSQTADKPMATRGRDT